MSYDGEDTPLTNFDRLAVHVSWLGAGIVLGVHFVFVDVANRGYRGGLSRLPKLSEVVYSPFFALSSAFLMIFLAYYGSRMRRLYDNRSASNVLFLSILAAIGTNFLQLWALFAPVGGSLTGLGSH